MPDELAHAGPLRGPRGRAERLAGGYPQGLPHARAHAPPRREPRAGRRDPLQGDHRGQRRARQPGDAGPLRPVRARLGARWAGAGHRPRATAAPGPTCVVVYGDVGDFGDVAGFGDSSATSSAAAQVARAAGGPDGRTDLRDRGARVARRGGAGRHPWRSPPQAESRGSKVPPGSSSGRRLRLRGKGRGGGDLYATVKIVVPKTLTDEERAAYERLRAVSTFRPRGAA